MSGIAGRRRRAEHGQRRGFRGQGAAVMILYHAAEQDGVMETLNALHTVRYELGLNTVLGVSNISFGLPYRELVNQNFLSMALTYGLTLPIINPNVVSMTGAVRAYRLLTGVDRNSMDYIQAYNGYTPAKSVKAEKSPEAQSGTANADAPEKGTLAYAVENRRRRWFTGEEHTNMKLTIPSDAEEILRHFR